MSPALTGGVTSKNLSGVCWLAGSEKENHSIRPPELPACQPFNSFFMCIIYLPLFSSHSTYLYSSFYCYYTTDMVSAEEIARRKREKELPLHSVTVRALVNIIGGGLPILSG